MALAYLSLGSNLGKRQENIENALRALNAMAQMQCIQCSSFYETKPWGFFSKHLFINAVAIYRTTLPPESLLQITKNVETSLGRTQKSHNEQYTDRKIDIDILMYNNLIYHSPQLILPHPYFHKRLFVLEPLVEIAPQIIHPLLEKTMTELLNELKKKDKY